MTIPIKKLNYQFKSMKYRYKLQPLTCMESLIHATLSMIKTSGDSISNVCGVVA